MKFILGFRVLGEILVVRHALYRGQSYFYSAQYVQNMQRAGFLRFFLCQYVEKVVFFLSNLAMLSKAQTLLDRTADILVRNSKLFPSPTPHFRSSFTWEQLPSSSLTSSSKRFLTSVPLPLLKPPSPHHLPFLLWCPLVHFNSKLSGVRAVMCGALLTLCKAS